MKYFLGALKKFADFNGRARRKEYWMFVLFYLIIYIALNIIDSLLGTMFISLIFILVMLIPSISIATRRLHDTSRSGWWQLLSLIPIVGGIVLIVFLAQDSHAENSFGPNPKQA
ncbi:DUF805 domain-containing protein [Aliikangiella sp. IMCC44359]|uniref:DUF805 domain-containing protein n=1 Tax=Aliikangiella sp. IMCC44359 TaxID=3459125 RepID=UPI00403B1866